MHFRLLFTRVSFLRFLAISLENTESFLEFRAIRCSFKSTYITEEEFGFVSFNELHEIIDFKRKLTILFVIFRVELIGNDFW